MAMSAQLVAASYNLSPIARMQAAWSRAAESGKGTDVLPVPSLELRFPTTC